MRKPKQDSRWTEYKHKNYKVAGFPKSKVFDRISKNVRQALKRELRREIEHL